MLESRNEILRFWASSPRSESDHLARNGEAPAEETEYRDGDEIETRVRELVRQMLSPFDGEAISVSLDGVNCCAT